MPGARSHARQKGWEEIRDSLEWAEEHGPTAAGRECIS